MVLRLHKRLIMILGPTNTNPAGGAAPEACESSVLESTIFKGPNIKVLKFAILLHLDREAAPQ